MDIVTLVKRSPIVFPLALAAAAVAMVLISEGSYWQSVGTLDELGAMAAARTTVQGLQQGMLDAETGQRGYLLVGRQEYLQPYAQAIKDIDDSLRFLDQHYREEPAPSEVLARLRTEIDAKLSEMALTIRLHDEGRREAITTIVLGDIGRERMDSIRALSAELLKHEAFRVAVRRDDLYRSLMLNRLGVAALSLISLLALFLYLRQTSALKNKQLELKRTVQDERDRLEIEVRHRTTQLTELTHHLLTAREDERNRMARNLHDELGALLTSAKLDAARIRSRLAGTAPERLAQQSGIELHCELAPVELKATAELVVYRVVQEAITNITKYAKASHVWLGMAARDGQVEVSVRDDGIGFDTGVKPNSAYGPRGHALSRRGRRGNARRGVRAGARRHGSCDASGIRARRGLRLDDADIASTSHVEVGEVAQTIVRPRRHFELPAPALRSGECGSRCRRHGKASRTLARCGWPSSTKGRFMPSCATPSSITPGSAEPCVTSMWWTVSRYR